MKTNIEQIQLLGKAIKTLDEVIKFIESKEFDIHYITYLNDSSTQRFEYTFELYRKTLKSILESQGVMAEDSGSPRQVLKLAHESGMIYNLPLRIEMMITRNRMSHVYDEETLEEIAMMVPGYLSHILTEYEHLCGLYL